MEQRGACLSLSKVISSCNGGSELKTLEKQIQPDDPAAVYFTTGSTGTPKAVVHSHAALVESSISVSEIHAHSNDSKPGCHHCVVQMYQVSFEALFAPMLTLGDRLVLPESVDIETFLYTLEKESCTSTVIYPPYAFEIANLAERHDFSSLKLALVGGNIVPQPVLDKLKKVLTPNIQNTFGMTEALLLTYHSPGDPSDGRIQTIGRPFPHSEIKLTDENFRTVPINTEGEICVRGPNVFQFYLGEEDTTSTVKSHTGWFKTGDFGKMLDDGRILHLGRKDDSIMKNVSKIYPVEIEKHIIGHSKVKLCQAVAVPDDKFINEICLCLVLRPEVKCTEEEIMEILKTNLDERRVPKYVLFFDSFPTAGSGKISRKKVAEMATERLKK
ncbi:putative acyl-CoA synthetase YngI [Ptychodera flava]|uniref:putative acyl-CoA synthetase YngI n=1 Tax=Ptychodera flava TaxID=63121 RepID=UPI00396A5DDD